jgi:hypothetical protein
LHQCHYERTVVDMPYDNSESKKRKSRSRRAMNLVVAGAVAVAPVIGCDTAAQPKADASSPMDATGSPDRVDAGVDMMAAVDAEDDGSLDSYPDGVRG